MPRTIIYLIVLIFFLYPHFVFANSETIEIAIIHNIEKPTIDSYLSIATDDLHKIIISHEGTIVVPANQNITLFLPYDINQEFNSCLVNGYPVYERTKIELSFNNYVLCFEIKLHQLKLGHNLCELITPNGIIQFVVICSENFQNDLTNFPNKLNQTKLIYRLLPPIEIKK